MDSIARKKFKRRLRLRTLFFLAIALSCNTFAWFIYISKVENSITAKVREWKVSFDVNGSNVSQSIELAVDSLYPGMETVNQVLNVSNNGETPARISYEVLEAKILGDNLKNYNLTDDEILEKLANDYPFTIDFVSSNDEITSRSLETITISVSWPYESGDDLNDTLWGNRAYDFHHASPTIPSIQLVIKVTAFQPES